MLRQNGANLDEISGHQTSAERAQDQFGTVSGAQARAFAPRH
jgi:hypothetical protein